MIPPKSNTKQVECIECGYKGVESSIIREQWFPEDDMPSNREYNDMCPICKMAAIVDSKIILNSLEDVV